MKKKKYNKLVRDRIPKILSEKGIRTKTHVATEKEYRTKLIEKLREEVDEFLKQENPEELT